MTRLNVAVTVADMLDALQVASDKAGIASYSDLPGERSCEVKALVAPGDIINEAIDMGYVDGDEAMDGLDPNTRDLADGLRALMEGDRNMAATLIVRALDHWPDAALAAETVLLSRTVHDRRQLSLLALAA